MPEDWRKANVSAFLKNSKKEDPGSNILISFTSAFGKEMEQLDMRKISRQVKQEDDQDYLACVEGEDTLDQPDKQL